MRSPAAGGWPVWKIHKPQPPSFKKVSRQPWGCIGALTALLLFWLGFNAALVALVKGQVLPILILLLGQLPLGIKLAKLTRQMRKPCPDRETPAPFLGWLTERGLRMATGRLASWSAFSGWAPGWEDSHVFRIHLRLAPEQDTRDLMQVQSRKWIFVNIAALLAAFYLAVILRGHAIALQACLYFAGLYLTLFLLRRWSKVALQKIQDDTPEEPWVLIFDTRQVSMAEVEALLERYLPRMASSRY